MTTPAYCPKCGVAWIAGARFCSSCGTSFTAAATSAEQSLATGLITVQNLWLKLVVGRLVGVAAGLAIWWFIAGPLFAGQFIPTIVSLVVLAFGGLLVGQMVTLSLVAGKR